MRQSLPLMHFYSGKLLQFCSGVDSGMKSLGEAGFSHQGHTWRFIEATRGVGKDAGAQLTPSRLAPGARVTGAPRHPSGCPRTVAHRFGDNGTKAECCSVDPKTKPRRCRGLRAHKPIGKRTNLLWYQRWSTVPFFLGYIPPPLQCICVWTILEGGKLQFT